MQLNDFKKYIKNADPIKCIKQLAWYKPMLATLTHEYFSDKDWIYERKFDGERCIIVKKGKNVQLYSRSKQLINKYYPDLVAEIKKQKYSFIADGEIIAFDKNISSFAKLQQRLRTTVKDINKIPFRVYLYLFDLLYLEKYELLKLDLIDRKKLLKKIFEFFITLFLLYYSC